MSENLTMQALVHAGCAGPAGLRLAQVPRPEARDNDVLVRIAAAGLNRHELFVIDAHTDNEPKIVGADAVGTIVATGDTAEQRIGDIVLINPCIGWTRTEDVPEVPTIIGGPIPGTFAEFITVPSVNVHPVPPHLSEIEAAALGLAGLTAYRALFTKGRLEAGQHVVITGATGGAGTLAVSMAAAAGAHVTVVTRHSSKVAQAIALGASHVVVGIDGFDEKLHTPADLVIDSVGASAFPAALKALRPGGRVISFGATTAPDISLSLRELFFRQVTLEGTSMGSAPEFDQMLRFVTENQIRPTVHTVRPLSEAADALREMASGVAFGKTVFTLGGITTWESPVAEAR
ncbi:quinone oxidoreductase family protein [Mycolicibacterium neoaurum]|uniref:Alcohol dehydrogenase n=1 Tax=Mycolicibacterium neoaurum TaxID=1795 RepID=A0AAV2WE80_MYCNE|nr:zinc-binding dehydrogenase [Mycolicibacterium neoaurum]CDQ42569.1 putative alcohol dehydrogenase [Mycolicibacterium neoaurum]